MPIDPEKIERQLAQMVAGLEPYIDGSDTNNVLARLQTQVVPAFVRWKTGEINRHSGENEVLNALVCFVSSQMVSTIGEVVGSTDFDEVHFQLANKLLNAIGEEVGSIMTGERKMEAFNVRAEQAH